MSIKKKNNINCKQLNNNCNHDVELPTYNAVLSKIGFVYSKGFYRLNAEVNPTAYHMESKVGLTMNKYHVPIQVQSRLRSNFNSTWELTQCLLLIN